MIVMIMIMIALLLIEELCRLEGLVGEMPPARGRFAADGVVMIMTVMIMMMTTIEELYRLAGCMGETPPAGRRAAADGVWAGAEKRPALLHQRRAAAIRGEDEGGDGAGGEDARSDQGRNHQGEEPLLPWHPAQRSHVRTGPQTRLCCHVGLLERRRGSDDL